MHLSPRLSTATPRIEKTTAETTIKTIAISPNNIKSPALFKENNTTHSRNDKNSNENYSTHIKLQNEKNKKKENKKVRD